MGHVRVIVPLLYKVTRRLLSIPSMLLRSEAAKDAELLVLRHENAVLRRQLAGPVRYEPADRFWFAALSGLVDRRRWQEVFPVTQCTLLAWHLKLMVHKWDYSARRRIGRPPTRVAVRLTRSCGASAPRSPRCSGTRSWRARRSRHHALPLPRHRAEGITAL